MNRTELLVGHDAYGRIRDARVIIFGVGGVGSWCAESLVRSGVGHLTMVDPDCVDPSNLNRQLPALHSTLGRPKVEVLRSRLLDIAPGADIHAVRAFYDASNADDFALDDYDYVVDAIDSLSSKALLIMRASSSRARLYSSMGAALKSDPSLIGVAEFWKVQGCPLARALRDRFKRSGERPRRKFKCVYSPERLSNAVQQPDGAGRVNGTLAHITAIFGFTLASLVVNDICRNP